MQLGPWRRRPEMQTDPAKQKGSDDPLIPEACTGQNNTGLEHTTPSPFLMFSLAQ